MTRATLTLMRHAKSSWDNQNQSDYDRPLNNRGHRDAPDMAKRLVARNSIPTLILCSSAQRTRETAAHLLDVFGEPAPQIQYDRDLYLASPETLLAALQQVPEDVKHIMLIAHNPGIEDLSARLQGITDDTLPTAAIRQFSCSCISDLGRDIGISLDPQHAASDARYTLTGDDSAPIIELIYSDYPKSSTH